jgi:hypothetical protein
VSAVQAYVGKVESYRGDEQVADVEEVIWMGEVERAIPDVDYHCADGD